MPDLKLTLTNLAGLTQANFLDFEPTVRNALSASVGKPFVMGAGVIADVNGAVSEAIPLVIHSAAGHEPGTPLAVNEVAVVFDFVEVLDRDSLRKAYNRIASVKQLDKHSTDRTASSGSYATHGQIVACKAAVPVEDITAELETLNGQYPSSAWPDVVVIAGVGTIEYAAQFPGEQDLAGAWVLPPRGIMKAFPGVFVVMTKGATPGSAHLRLAYRALLALVLFREGAELPTIGEIMSPLQKQQNAITVTGYQYDLGGELRPVPTEFYRDRMAPDPPLYIYERGKQEPLAALRFIPWQGGGVIAWQGKLPLHVMLALSGLAADHMSVLPRPGGLQVSYVLPIDETGFRGMLSRFTGRSNLEVRRAPTKFVVQKIGDEGTSSPYIARLLLGLLKVRDMVFGPELATRKTFDLEFESMAHSIAAAREAAAEVGRIWSSHAEKVSTGKIVKRGHSQLTLTESVDRDLRRSTEAFLNSATRMLKHNMQTMSKTLGVDTGCIFRQQASFEIGVQQLAISDPLLAQYLKGLRTWSEPLILARNAVEHEGWVLPKVRYDDNGIRVAAVEPELSGRRVTEFVEDALDHSCCAIEDILVHLLQQKLPAGLTLSEIPLGERRLDAPERFALTLAQGGRLPWRLRFTTTPFADR